MTTASYTEPEPYDWWGIGLDRATPLSIVDLLRQGSLDLTTAATLWLLLTARASIIVVASEAGVGKTTTLSAISDFLPTAIARIYLRGWSERFVWATTANPATSYLLCNEISQHLPGYLWGSQVSRLFATVAQGFSFGATLHAASAEETLQVLAGPPLQITPDHLARIDCILTLAATPTEDGLHRHLHTLTIFTTHPAQGDGQPLLLAQWDAQQRAVIPCPIPPALAQRCGYTPADFATQQAHRAGFLATLCAGPVQRRGMVRQALASYVPTTKG